MKTHRDRQVQRGGRRGGAIRVSSILDSAEGFGGAGSHGQEPDVLGHDLTPCQRPLNSFRGCRSTWAIIGDTEEPAGV